MLHNRNKISAEKQFLSNQCPANSHEITIRYFCTLDKTNVEIVE